MHCATACLQNQPHSKCSVKLELVPHIYAMAQGLRRLRSMVTQGLVELQCTATPDMQAVL